MTKYFLTTLIVISTSTIASESKVICGHEKFHYGSGGGASVLYDVEEKAITDINSKIKMAEAEGFTKVSAPMGVESGGHTQSFCVTVTKP